MPCQIVGGLRRGRRAAGGGHSDSSPPPAPHGRSPKPVSSTGAPLAPWNLPEQPAGAFSGRPEHHGAASQACTRAGRSSSLSYLSLFDVLQILRPFVLPEASAGRAQLSHYWLLGSAHAGSLTCGVPAPRPSPGDTSDSKAKPSQAPVLAFCFSVQKCGSDFLPLKKVNQNSTERSGTELPAMPPGRQLGERGASWDTVLGVGSLSAPGGHQAGNLLTRAPRWGAPWRCQGAGGAAGARGSTLACDQCGDRARVPTCAP